MKILKKIMVSLTLPLLSANMAIAAMPRHCPAPDNIMRVEGSYDWKLKPRKYRKGVNTEHWAGYFTMPLQGKGHSTAVKYFMEARWIQLNNLSTSPGFIECDYRGNYKKEVIRFSLKNAHAICRPKSNRWVYTLNAKFPSVAAHCGGDPIMCRF